MGITPVVVHHRSIKRTSGPDVPGAGAFGLNTQSLQEGGELDVTDEAEGGEVTW